MIYRRCKQVHGSVWKTENKWITEVLFILWKLGRANKKAGIIWNFRQSPVCTLGFRASCPDFVGKKEGGGGGLMKLPSASLDSKYSFVHLQPSVPSADCQMADWRNNSHINCKHIICSLAGQASPFLARCFLFFQGYYFWEPSRIENLVLANKM